MLTKLSGKIGFTNTEIKVVLFLVTMFITGLSYKIYLINDDKPDFTNFDYSDQDKLFQESGRKTGKDSINAVDNNVDYKQEVLDFNNRNFSRKEAKTLPGLKSIDINAAGLNELVQLPGIGNKTAEKIIALRKEKSGFKKLDELLEIKGIGGKKLSNIEKYLYIKN